MGCELPASGVEKWRVGERDEEDEMEADRPVAEEGLEVEFLKVEEDEPEGMRLLLDRARGGLAPSIMASSLSHTQARGYGRHIYSAGDWR